MKNDPIEAKLSVLRAVDAATPPGCEQLQKALADRSNLVVKKAAQIAAGAKQTLLLPDLRKALDRFLAAPQTDKGCAALNALVTALVELDFDEPEPFLAGIRHVQMEPVWGGSVDVAVDLRANCAIGLVNTRYPKTLDALATLLADPNWPARAGAVRALGVQGSDAAALLLRYKALIGDAERDVLVECFTALLQFDEANIAFVSQRMQSDNEEVESAAVLALGSSRHEQALAALQKKLRQPRLGPLRRTVLIAIASMRLDTAVEFVKELAAEEDAEAIAVLRDLRFS